MPLDLMRGFASVHDTVPTIVLNNDDHPCARAFTVLHELAHLALSAAGARATERRANEFAGEVIMPRDWLREEFQALSGRPRMARVDLLARTFGVTPLAAAVRVRRTDVVPGQDIEPVIAAIRSRTAPPKGKGKGHYY